MRLIFLYAILIVIVSSCDNGETGNFQYELALDIAANPDCRINIYKDKAETHFIMKKFAPNQFVSHEAYQKNLNYNLNAESKKIQFDSMISGTSSSHQFLKREFCELFLRALLTLPHIVLNLNLLK